MTSYQNKWLLRGPYTPAHSDNLMSDEGDVKDARETFINDRFENLDFLLNFRYAWMNDYLQPNSVVVEVGAGAGFSELYLKKKPVLTDATVENPWIDKYLDATNMDLENNSVDVIIASHNIHHFYSPYKFFKECERVLKHDGLVLIQEINTSLMMRALLKVMRHEGWSYEVNVFDENEIVNDAGDLWSANCAVPELLFDDSKRFEETFKNLEVRRNELCECFIFPLSGGVISKTRVPAIPKFILRVVSLLDSFLIMLFPNIFALGRRVVISRKK